MKTPTEQQFTAGPWHVGIKQAHRIVYDSKGWAVADATVYHGEESKDEMLANARLIAAAPELLEACRLVADRLGNDCPLNEGELIAVLESAINKATKPGLTGQGE